MTQPHLTTLVAFLLDETGSMQAVKDQTVSGFNEYVGGLKGNADGVRFTLTRFNSLKCEVELDAVPPADIPMLTDRTYRPDASTPLYDAIGRTIAATEEALKKHPADRVLFVIQTDGQENASHEYNLDAVRRAITSKEALGTWSFVYFGADQDAWAHAQTIGMQKANVLAYAGRDTRVTMCMASERTSSYLASASLSTGDHDGGFWKSESPRKRRASNQPALAVTPPDTPRPEKSDFWSGWKK